MIEFKDVHKKYGKLEVLKGVSFTIKDGGIIAILGPNGSGKTTSMKSFLGMVVSTSRTNGLIENKYPTSLRLPTSLITSK